MIEMEMRTHHKIDLLGRDTDRRKAIEPGQVELM